jgi:predicted DNA-binding protein
MRNLSITVNEEIGQRLEALAVQTGNSVDGCVVIALQEFLEGWEDYLRMVSLIHQGEARPMLGGA